jgi:hypothetical protein
MKLSSILLEMLNEIGGNTYELSKPKIQKSSPRSNTVKYFFTSKAGSEYEVVFESEFLSGSDKHKWETDVSFDKIREDDEYQDLYMFSDEEKYSETNEKDAIAILFTVAEAVKAFISDFKPEFLTYSGSMSGKELFALSDPDRKADAVKMTTVRDRIYDRMVKSMISEFPDYTFDRSGYNMDIFYKGELPVPGHPKIFNYPVKK